jgi:hypothetical protein
MISPDSGEDIIKDFHAGPGVFDHLAVVDVEPEQFQFNDTNAGVLISWDTGSGEGYRSCSKASTRRILRKTTSCSLMIAI